MYGVLDVGERMAMTTPLDKDTHISICSIFFFKALCSSTEPGHQSFLRDRSLTDLKLTLEEMQTDNDALTNSHLHVKISTTTQLRPLVSEVKPLH